MATPAEPAPPPALAAADDRRGRDHPDRDAKCCAWLQETEELSPKSAAERLAAFEEVESAWCSATNLPVDRDFVEAATLLRGNALLEACMDGGLAVETGEYGPAHWMGDASGKSSANVVWIALADATGSQVALWNERHATPDEAPRLRVCLMGSEGEMSGLAPSFRDFLRCLATVPLEEPVPFLGDTAASCGCVEGGRLWAALEEQEADERLDAASLRAGRLQLASFLESVWGVSPVGLAEVQGWQQDLQATAKGLEAFVAAIQDEASDNDDEEEEEDDDDESDEPLEDDSEDERLVTAAAAAS